MPHMELITPNVPNCARPWRRAGGLDLIQPARPLVGSYLERRLGRWMWYGPTVMGGDYGRVG
eukprot:7740002-Pyramimonas_sp.AAC.1